MKRQTGDFGGKIWPTELADNTVALRPHSPKSLTRLLSARRCSSVAELKELKVAFRYRWYHGSLALILCCLFISKGWHNRPVFWTYDKIGAVADHVFRSGDPSGSGRLRRILSFPFSTDCWSTESGPEPYEYFFCEQVELMARNAAGRAALRQCMTQEPLLGNCADMEFVSEMLAKHESGTR